MSIKKGTIEQVERRGDEATIFDDANRHKPRKMTVAENVIMTIKVLGGLGLIGTAIWGVDVWMAPK